ncbi:MAG: ankyrin repeat domain-containing protein [Tatlockia sp.]|nr:ankyrin repeat domain-containing protein [Tatlockia sp.]
MPNPSEKLQKLMGRYAFNPWEKSSPTYLSLEEFKNMGMTLAREGADLRITETIIGTEETFLHFLVLYNEKGKNQEEIEELLRLNSTIINVKNGLEQTLLQSLMNQFIRKECSLEDFKKTALFLAKRGIDLSVTDTEDIKGTLIHHFVLNNKNGENDKEIAELLQINPTLINILDGYGRIPLQSLLRKESDATIHTIEKLIDLGSNINSKCPNNITLLHSCCFAGNLTAAKYFASQGLDLKARAKGKTMLHSSVRHKNADLWEWILNNEINIDAQDDLGDTTLHFAAANRNSVMIEWLILNNADSNLLNNQGVTALQIAQECEFPEITSILIKLNAKDLSLPKIENSIDTNTKISNSTARFFNSEGRKETFDNSSVSNLQGP